MNRMTDSDYCYSAGHLLTGSEYQHEIAWGGFGDMNADPWLIVHGNAGYIVNPHSMTAFNMNKDHILVLHQRGVGESRPTGLLSENTYHDLAADIETFRDHQNIGKFNILAWSGGASIAAMYASTFPEHVGKLVAYAPFFGTREELVQMFALYANRGNRWTDYSVFHGETDPEALMDKHIAAVSSQDNKKSMEAVQVYGWLGDKAHKSIYDFIESKSLEEWLRLQNNFRIHTQQMAMEYGLCRNEVTNAFKKISADIPVTLIVPGSDVVLSGQKAKELAAEDENIKLLYAKDASHDIHDPSAQHFLGKVLHCSGCQKRGSCLTLQQPYV